MGTSQQGFQVDRPRARRADEADAPGHVDRADVRVGVTAADPFAGFHLAAELEVYARDRAAAPVAGGHTTI